MNKALLDTDIYSEVLKAKNPTVAQNGVLYRQQHGIYTVCVITVMEVQRSDDCVIGSGHFLLVLELADDIKLPMEMEFWPPGSGR